MNGWNMDVRPSVTAFNNQMIPKGCPIIHLWISFQFRRPSSSTRLVDWIFHRNGKTVKRRKCNFQPPYLIPHQNWFKVIAFDLWSTFHFVGKEDWNLTNSLLLRRSASTFESSIQWFIIQNHHYCCQYHQEGRGRGGGGGYKTPPHHEKKTFDAFVLQVET